MNVFDIIGPIMIGPSSSHTAGACRLGRFAKEILGKEIKKAEITFSGSFAKTYKGHGTDKAILAGIMGLKYYDEKIRDAFALIKEKGIEYEIKTEDIINAHPNTAQIILTSIDNETSMTQGASIGGGNIMITNINGIDVHFSGEYNTILVVHKDLPGAIAKFTEMLAEKNINITGFNLSHKKEKGINVMTIEVENDIDDDIIKRANKEDYILKAIPIKKL